MGPKPKKFASKNKPVSTCGFKAAGRVAARLAGMVSAVCLTALLVTGCASKQPPVQALDSEAYLMCHHFQRETFEASDALAESYEFEDGKLLAATSPHFIPAMTFTCKILKTVAAQDTPCQTVIVIAPGHSGEGAPIMISDLGWRTPWGDLVVDERATQAIYREYPLGAKVQIDRERIEQDHSASALMPYIKYYLPDVQIVTVLLNRSARLEDLAALSKVIAEIAAQKEVFVLASIDFSHYQPYEQTLERDAVTERLITAGDTQALKDLDGKNLDSPEAMIVLMNYAARREGSEAKILEKTILREAEPNGRIGYSYYVWGFGEAKSERHDTAKDLV